MNLADVMDEIATKLSTIPNLRVFPYPPDSLQPPAAVVAYPETYTFDQTYVRGMDRLTVPVVIVEGKPTDRSSRDRLAEYCDGSGPRSVKAALESGDYSAFDSLRVMSIEFDVVTIAGTDYLAALFDLDVSGSGV